MESNEWKKKRLGSGTLYIHPKLDHAVVDKKGMGVNPGVFYIGQKFGSVDEAKEFALRDKS